MASTHGSLRQRLALRSASAQLPTHSAWLQAATPFARASSLSLPRSQGAGFSGLGARGFTPLRLRLCLRLRLRLRSCLRLCCCTALRQAHA